MKKVGALGERLVGRFLELHNYDLLEQNWSCRWGEIDIIAWECDRQTVAFVEVKTRSKHNWDENGLLAVNYGKQEKIIKTASFFLAKYPHLAESPCRFDVALVSYGKYLTPQRKNNDKEEAHIALKKLVELTISQPVIIEGYKFAIEDYLQSAFDG